MAKRKKRRKLAYFSRAYWVPAILVLIIIAVVSRLVILQVVQAADLKAKGIERRTTDQTIYPERGIIFDAQGHIMAQNIPVKEVYADPKTLNTLINKKQIKSSITEIAEKLGSIIEADPQEITDKLSNDKSSWVSLAHHVDISKIDEINKLDIPGIGFNDEQKRVYPMDSLCASVLGIINMSGHGVEGIEAFYDQELYGKAGYKSQEQDTGSVMIPGTLHQIDPSKPGNNLTLTLDSTIQFFVEQNLDDIMSSTKCLKATIIAMDPMTGKILGMGSRPTFDPNNYSDSSPDDRRNLAIAMTYESGSTFKILTGSGALEEGVITPEELFNDPGYLRIGPRLITNWDSDVKAHGSLTFTEGMKVSSNVVLAQVGLKMGKESFYTFLKAFGLGAKTGIDIAGEESGLLVPEDKAKDIDLATMSFGQSNLVTPIQLLSAISAVANGGTLYKPYIVDKITTSEGEIVKQNQPCAVRQVVSKTTAAQMNSILEQVVSKGTGKLAIIPGVKVAGKTGTAQKVNPETGAYSPSDFIASFAAFAPVENPKIAVLVVLDSPQGIIHQGGQLAAPRAKNIIEKSLQYFGVPVAEDTKSSVSISSAVPTVRPAPKQIIPERTPAAGEVVVPDLTGLTMRQAGEKLSANGLHYDFSGNGLVSEQIPAGGKVVAKGTAVEVKFSSLTTVIMDGASDTVSQNDTATEN
ncbi:MAG TPA: penicillin-binding transpeptidase domain-containing protein [Desulfitobacteriaceae bacterium]|nr:penicillin-binding transpeptidase domain-containing protein [Desulfitobacteriaceae bacterium]